MILDTFFSGIFPASSSTIDPRLFLACLGCALVLGFALALIYRIRTRTSQGFVHALALLPAIVCVVIMMVNGNVGAGVAVAGAFSLVRFRSAPGTAREIGAIFLAMASGLICGMGYLGYAVLFTVVLGGVMLAYQAVGFARQGYAGPGRCLRVTVPENLNYTDALDGLLDEYCVRRELVQVKTANMGSLYKLVYLVELRDSDREQELLDRIRCRNGNLEVCIMRQEVEGYEL